MTRSVTFSLGVTDGIFVSRQAGSTRYGTAATVATRAFSAPVPVAYIVTGLDFPDGLAAAAAGAHLGGPVLLVDSIHNSVPSETASALRTLRPARLVVVGGTSVVSSAVVSKLASIVGSGTPISRVAGADRYATAAAVATSQFRGPVPVAYVATGRTYPDALAGSAPAGDQGGPVLLVDGLRSTIPSATRSALTALAPARIIVLGGTGAVSAGIAAALDAYTSGSVTRLSGSDRYATAAAVATKEFAPGVAYAYVATGDNFPDALGAGAAAGARSGPVLLVHGGTSTIPSATRSALTTLRPQNIVVVGGTSVVSSSIQTQLASYVVH